MSHRRSRATWAAAALMLCACARQQLGANRDCDERGSGGCVQSGESFAVDRAHSRQVAPGWLRIALDSVTEDSRCAIGVQCVWQGRAAVRLAVDSGPVGLHVVLRTDSAATTAFGRAITLDSVVPYPRAGGVIALSQYQAWLHVR